MSTTLFTRGLGLLAALALAACVAAEPPAMSPTPAVVAVISTPYVGYAAATPPARLYDQPGGAAGATLPRGADLLVVAMVVAADGQVWYRVTADGAAGWLPAGAVSLVDDELAPTQTPRPPLATATARPATEAPSPRPLVVAGSGQGLFLRVEPGQGAVVRAYPDGAIVVPLGESTTLEGRRWLRVRAPDGQEGWMAAEYLRPAP